LFLHFFLVLGECWVYLAKDISKRAIAKLVDCSKSTLYNWLEREGLNKKKPKSKATETKA
jgi:transposase